jgi:NitT/TauT family transport system ATP-binding protein
MFGLAPGAAPKLSVRGLGKSFGSGPNRKDVLGDVSFEVATGEFVCVVGPSGIGKSTLLGCLGGLQSPSWGYAYMDGQPIVGPPRKTAVVFQEYTRSLMPWLSVGRNVALPLRGRDMSRREIRDRSLAALADVGLVDTERNYPWQLSGGMQQRVAIARALAYEPDVMLMDEPFASVDAQTRLDLEDLVLRIQEEHDITIVMVTHDIDEAVYLADWVVVLGGRPCQVVSVIEVDLARPRDQIVSRADPKFISIRTDVMGLIRVGKGEVSDSLQLVDGSCAAVEGVVPASRSHNAEVE